MSIPQFEMIRLESLVKQKYFHKKQSFPTFVA